MTQILLLIQWRSRRRRKKKLLIQWRSRRRRKKKLLIQWRSRRRSVQCKEKINVMNIDVPGLFCYFQKLLSCDAKNLVFVSIQYTF